MAGWVLRWLPGRPWAPTLGSSGRGSVRSRSTRDQAVRTRARRAGPSGPRLAAAPRRRRSSRRRRAPHRRGGPTRRRGRGPGTGVSGRPSPRVGRSTSCWCSGAVPALRAPRLRLASRGLEVAGALHVPGRATVAPKPGAYRSTAASIRCDLPVERGLVGRQPRGRCVYAHDRLGAGRRARRVGGRHLAEQHERVRAASGRPRGRRPRRRARRRRRRGAPCPAARAPGAVHGIRRVERPVDLEGRVVPLEAARGRRAAGAAGARRPTRSAVQHRRRHVGEHRAARPHASAVGEPHAARPARRRRGPRSPGRRSAPARPATPRAGGARGRAPRAAPGTGNPTSCAEHREQPAEQRAARRCRGTRRCAGRCPRAGPAPPRRRTPPGRAGAPTAAPRRARSSVPGHARAPQQAQARRAPGGTG